ncbi:hypothetical protein KR009_003971, partial [Drosophila setifemur]
ESELSTQDLTSDVCLANRTMSGTTIKGYKSPDTKSLKSTCMQDGEMTPPYGQFLRDFKKRYGDYYTELQLSQAAARRWNEMSPERRCQYAMDETQTSQSKKDCRGPSSGSEDVDDNDDITNEYFFGGGCDKKPKCCAKPKKKKCCAKPKPKCAAKPKCPKPKPKCAKPKPKCAKPKPKCPKQECPKKLECPKKQECPPQCPKPKPKCPKPKPKCSK